MEPASTETWPGATTGTTLSGWNAAPETVTANAPALAAILTSMDSAWVVRAHVVGMERGARAGDRERAALGRALVVDGVGVGAEAELLFTVDFLGDVLVARLRVGLEAHADPVAQVCK